MLLLELLIIGLIIPLVIGGNYKQGRTNMTIIYLDEILFRSNDWNEACQWIDDNEYNDDCTIIQDECDEWQVIRQEQV